MTARAPFGGAVFIADKSAWEHSGDGSVRAEWRQALRASQIATCPITMMELLFSTRNRLEFEEVESRLRALRNMQLTRTVTEAALSAMRDLAASGSGKHRVPAPDALVAACAQDAGIGVLHHDRHFDRLAEVLRFESRWIVSAD